MKRRSKIPMVVGGGAVTALLLVMSGACSQHDPGAWQGGGRSFEVPTMTATTVPPDSGVPDISVPDISVPDTFVPPDTGGGG